jgi:ketosteroid isomerase-like protein
VRHRREPLFVLFGSIRVRDTRSVISEESNERPAESGGPTMPPGNVEIVVRAMDAFNESNALVGTGDPLPWLREFCDADLELDLSRRAIDPDVYHGYEGFLRLGEQDRDAWQEARFEVEEVIDAGDRVVLFTYNSGLAKSGVKLAVRVGQVLTLSGAKIIRWQFFGEDRAACLEAAGLTE